MNDVCQTLTTLPSKHSPYCRSTPQSVDLWQEPPRFLQCTCHNYGSATDKEFKHVRKCRVEEGNTHAWKNMK